VRLLAFSQTARQDVEILRQGLGLIYNEAPRHLAAIVCLALVAALLPAAHIWLLKQIIDTVAAATRGHSVPADPGRTTLILAGSYLLLACFQQSLRGITPFLHGHVHEFLAGRVTMRVMEKASTYPDLSPFESPRFYDQLQLLEQNAAYRPMNLLSSLIDGLQSGLVLLSMLFLLARYQPALVLVLAVTAGPGAISQRRLQQAAWWGLADLIPLRRRLEYYTRVLLTAPFAKEVRLFGLAGHVLGWYRERFAELMARARRTRWELAGASLALSVLAALGLGGAFAYVIYQALRGTLTLGDLSLYTGALFQASGAAAGLVSALASLYEALPFMRELFAFLNRAPEMQVPVSGRLLSRCPHRGFRLEEVAFCYPEAARPVFQGLDLEIPCGRTTALIGENGAGKSTLVKLLTRLYDPTDGRILLDGIDLREYDLEDLRRSISGVFQDFARYQLSAWENIGLGDVDRIGDHRRITEAARRAGAEPVIRRLPGGEATMLGPEFDGGVELSGGEWQKIALARAFMRDAPIVILDEPTAALDARAEYEIYRRFLELAAGRTSLLISHRFSTVRMAELIIVLEGGAVIEQGDHCSLMARGSRYAELYTMQAEQYQR
jgi:ATP-binding cassette, subfamily B, bacterial